MPKRAGALLFWTLALSGCGGRAAHDRYTTAAGSPSVPPEMTAGGAQSGADTGGQSGRGDGGGQGGDNTAGNGSAGSAGSAGANGIQRSPLTPGFYVIPMLPTALGGAHPNYNATNRLFYVADDASWVLGATEDRSLPSGAPSKYEVYGWTETSQVGFGPLTELLAINSDASELVVSQNGIFKPWRASIGLSVYDDVQSPAPFNAAAINADTHVLAGAVARDLGSSELSNQAAVRELKQGVRLIDDFSGYRSCELKALSGDGQHGFGVCTDAAPSPSAVQLNVHWSASSGLEPLIQWLGVEPPELADCQPNYGQRLVNDDGTVLVGACNHQPTAFRWTKSQGLSTFALPEVPGVPGAVTDFTENGRFLIGERLDPSGGVLTSFRWTREHGLEVFKPFTGADSTSLPHPRINSTLATRGAFGTRAMSADGSLVAGTSYLSTSPRTRFTQAFRWTPSNGMAALPMLSGDTWSRVTSVSQDGSIIVGISGYETHQSAVFWDERGDVYSVARVLTEAGIDFTDSELLSAEGAPNARVLWGTGKSLEGEDQVWLVRLP